jgi:hypothetical protein
MSITPFKIRPSVSIPQLYPTVQCQRLTVRTERLPNPIQGVLRYAFEDPIALVPLPHWLELVRAGTSRSFRLHRRLFFTHGGC